MKGRVTDESGAPVIGATVILKGTTVGTATNATGEYAIDIRQADAVLVYSLIGYNKVEVALSEGQTQADVTLKSEAIAMDNVVVVGYGVQEQARRDDGHLVHQGRGRLRRHADGRFPRRHGRQDAGRAGAGYWAARARRQRFDPHPRHPVGHVGQRPALLVLIDGVPCDARAFSNLESSDIESLEVLKDASAAAIYGSRGSCGVILHHDQTRRGRTPRREL